MKRLTLDQTWEQCFICQSEEEDEHESNNSKAFYAELKRLNKIRLAK